MSDQAVSVKTDELSLNPDQEEYVENGCNPDVREFVREAENFIEMIQHLRERVEEDTSDERGKRDRDADRPGSLRGASRVRSDDPKNPDTTGNDS